MCAHIMRLVGCLRPITINVHGIHHSICWIHLHVVYVDGPLNMYACHAELQKLSKVAYPDFVEVTLLKLAVAS